MRLTTAVLLTVLAAGETASCMAQKHVPGPHIIVYKTKADYRNKVPVELSEDGTRIVSYPAPGDLVDPGTHKSKLPVVLHKGYLLDKRGISKNVAFLKLTYDEYPKLQSIPSLTEMYGMILDKKPLLEIYDCGLEHKFKYTEKEMNKLIDKRKLKSSCKNIR